jgi:hypothetical protein
MTVESNKLLYVQSRMSFCASPSCRLRLGLQSLGLAQKDSLLLLMILAIYAPRALQRRLCPYNDDYARRTMNPARGL